MFSHIPFPRMCDPYPWLVRDCVPLEPFVACRQSISGSKMLLGGKVVSKQQQHLFQASFFMLHAFFLFVVVCSQPLLIYLCIFCHTQRVSYLFIGGLKNKLSTFSCHCTHTHTAIRRLACISSHTHTNTPATICFAKISKFFTHFFSILFLFLLFVFFVCVFFWFLPLWIYKVFCLKQQNRTKLASTISAF